MLCKTVGSWLLAFFTIIILPPASDGDVPPAGELIAVDSMSHAFLCTQFRILAEKFALWPNTFLMITDSLTEFSRLAIFN